MPRPRILQTGIQPNKDPTPLQALRIGCASVLLGAGGLVAIALTAAFVLWIVQTPVVGFSDAPGKPDAWPTHIHSLRNLGLLALLGWSGCVAGALISRGVDAQRERWVPIGAVLVASAIVVAWVAF